MLFLSSSILTLLAFLLPTYTAELYLGRPYPYYEKNNVRVAANDYVGIQARNDANIFTITTGPFTKDAIHCNLLYSNVDTSFVYNVAVGAEQRTPPFTFTFIARRKDRQDTAIFFVVLKQYPGGCLNQDYFASANITGLANVPSECVLSIHPLGMRAYAVGDKAAAIVEATQSVWYIEIWGGMNARVYPKAIGVSKDNLVFVGGDADMNGIPLPFLFSYNFTDAYFGSWRNFVKLLDYSEVFAHRMKIPLVEASMSMSVYGSAANNDLTVAVGLPHLDTVVFYMLDSKGTLYRKVNTSPQKDIDFGRSLFLTNNGIYGVLASSRPTLPWATSRIQFYTVPNYTSPNESSPLPHFVFPNNQQTITPQLGLGPLPYDFLYLFPWNSGFGVVIKKQTNQHALLLTASPPGSVSSGIHADLLDFAVYGFSPCISGTHKNISGLGPCRLCPIDTKNNGSFGVQCKRCETSNVSFCLAGATTEVNKERLISYLQAESYPDTSDTTEFGDVLLNHIFKLVTTRGAHCILVTPMFWALVALALGLIILFVLVIFGYFHKTKRSRTFVKRFLMHLDLIGEGQLWFGGRASLGIVVLSIFTFRFSISFAGLYPIENILRNARAPASCDPYLLNAKFSSSLQSLATIKNDGEKHIFDMLDEQNLTLTVEFISTGFGCDQVTVQENLVRGQNKRISTNDFNCTYERDNGAILAISTRLPQHLVTMEYTLDGPFFVGGLRVCLTGFETAANENKYTVKQLDFCHFMYARDQVLTVEPIVHIEMTKVINRTAAGVTIIANSDDVFTGIWLLTLTTSRSTLSDAHIYKSEKDEYRRYLNTRVSLIVDITQAKFYIQNDQEPIARGYEITFKTVLFSMLLLDLFGLLFLVFKLGIVPLLPFVQRACFSMYNKEAGIVVNRMPVNLPGLVTDVEETLAKTQPAITLPVRFPENTIMAVKTRLRQSKWRRNS